MPSWQDCHPTPGQGQRDRGAALEVMALSWYLQQALGLALDSQLPVKDCRSWAGRREGVTYCLRSVQTRLNPCESRNADWVYLRDEGRNFLHSAK